MTQALPAPRPARSGRLRRWLIRGALAVAGLLVTVVIAGAALGTCWLRRSLPQLEGTVAVPAVDERSESGGRGPAGSAGGEGVRPLSIDHPVRVTRDAHGVPMIEAESETDLFFGLGYVHAQDRFFQMELQRRTGQGRLSEIAGPSQIETDTFLRTLGLYRLSIDDERRVGAEAQRALAGYAAGVNAWLSAHADQLPPELDLLRVSGVRDKPEPWRAADSLVTGKLIAFNLSYNFEGELTRSDVEDKIGPGAEALLFPAYPLHAPVTVGGAEEPGEPRGAPSGTDRSGALDPGSSHGSGQPDRSRSTWGRASEPDPARSEVRRVFAGLGVFGRGVGSNAWVIGPSRSATGHALLANDPHLGIQNPNAFYMAHLKAPGWDTVGATIPGVPAIVLGRNAHIAWGTTALGADNQDLYVEKVDPADPAHYLFRGESRAFERRVETIRVNGGAPVSVTVRATVHGPVIRDDWKRRGPLALRWTSLDPGDQTLDALLGLGRARNWTEFRQAAARIGGPTQNLLYADVDGHIGYVAAGKVPVRARGQGLVPQPGWDGDAEWTGVVPFEQMPSELDPPRGFIVSANNKVAGDGTPFLSAEWDHHRAQRICDLILAKPRIAFEDLRAMQADVLSLFARDLVPVLVTAPADGPLEQEALARLARWDLQETPSSAEGALLMVWYVHLMSALFDDELGADLAVQWGQMRADALLGVLRDPSGALCDDVRTPQRESCRDILGRTLRAALAELRSRLGETMDDWRLDRLRIARFENPVASGVPLLGSLFTRSLGLGGDPFTVRVNNFWLGKPYETRLVQSYLGEFELPGPSRMILAPGQSGHPWSPHFDDLLKDWREVRPLPVGGTPDSPRILMLVPQAGGATAQKETSQP